MIIHALGNWRRWQKRKNERVTRALSWYPFCGGKSGVFQSSSDVPWLSLCATRSEVEPQREDSWHLVHGLWRSRQAAAGHWHLEAMQRGPHGAAARLRAQTKQQFLEYKLMIDTNEEKESRTKNTRKTNAS